MRSSVGEVLSKLRVWGVSGIKDYVSKNISWRCMARRLRRISALDVNALPMRGITLIGEFKHGASNSKTNRDFAHALKDAGIPFQTYSIDRSASVPESDYVDIMTPVDEFRLHKYTHVIEMFRSPLPRELVERRARIAFWEGEHGILDVWPFLSGSDPVIGMSDFNVEYFKREFKAPVYKILYPLRKIDVSMPSREAIRDRFCIGHGDFMVLFTFDFGSYRRKNPLAAIRAFANAFPGAMDARLVFKTMGARSHTAELAEVKREAAELGVADRFTVITEYLPHAELYGLTNACDVYISLHRGEGFGIGMAEAMLMGRPVVATDWSANTEFCRPGSSVPVKYSLAPVKPSDYFPSMQEWAEPDIDDAARHLRECYDNREMAAEVGARGKAFVEEHFSTANFKASVEAFLDGSLSEHSSDDSPGKNGIQVTKKRNSRAGKTELAIADSQKV